LRDWRKFLIDKLLLFAGALVFIALGICSFLLAEKHHVPKEFVFAAGIGLGFIWVVGRHFRSKLRHPTFLIFFLLWVATHTAGSVLVLFTFNLIVLLEFTVAELAIGYVVAYLLLG